jgi:hypothetical protein
MILGIQTTDHSPIHMVRLTAKLFASMKTNFVGEHRPLKPAMLPGGDEGAGAANAAGGPIPSPTPAPAGGDIPLPSLDVVVGNIPSHTPAAAEPNPPPPPRDPTPSPARETFEGATNIGGDFHVSSTRSNEAPNTTGQPVGGVEDPDTLTSMSTFVNRCLHKIEELEKDLKDTKQTLGTAVLTLIKRVKKLEDQIKNKKTKVVVSDSEDDKAAPKEHFDLDGLHMLASATLASANTKAADFDMGANVQPTTDQEPDITIVSYSRRTRLHRLRRKSGGSSFETYKLNISATSRDVPAGSFSVTAGSAPIPAPIPSGVPLGAVPAANIAIPTIGSINDEVPVVTVFANVPSGGSLIPIIHITALHSDVSSAPINKGKSPMVEEEPPVKHRTKRQIEEDRFGEKYAQQLHAEELENVARQQEELRIQEELARTIQADLHRDEAQEPISLSTQRKQ